MPSDLIGLVGAVRLAAAGAVAPDVALLLGSTRDEDASFVGEQLYWNMTAKDFEQWAHDLYNFTTEQRAELTSLYPEFAFPRSAYYSPWWWATVRAASDQDMKCPARRGARWFAAANASVWLYRFVRPRNGSETVPHTAEVPYVWHDLGAVGPPTGTDADIELSDELVRYWRSFAAAADPNGNGGGGEQGPAWPRYELGPRGDVTMQLDVGAGLVPLLESDVANCAWWERHDPCFLHGNATAAEWRTAAELGCGNL